jgi:hypothetical protein
VPTSPLADEPDESTVFDVPAVSEDAMELDLATARGGQHRLLRRGWLAYAMWIFAPLGVALVIAAITSLPGPETGTPSAGGPASKLPGLPPPTPNTHISPPAGDIAVPVSITSHHASSPNPSPHSPHSTPAVPPVLGPPAVAPSSMRPASTPPVTPTADAITMEAEAGALGSQLTTEQVAGASGGLIVTGLGKNSHRTLTLPNVTVTVSGYYRLDLGYTASEQIGIDVHTSAGGDASMSCPATPADTVDWCDTLVLLRAGDNSISVEGQQNNADAGLDLVIVSSY